MSLRNSSDANYSRALLAYDYILKNPQAKYTEIQQIFHVSSKIVSALKRCIRRGTKPDKILLGKRPKITKEHKEEIKLKTFGNCGMGSHRLAFQLEAKPAIRKSSVNNVRHELGFSYQNKRKAPRLTQDQKDLRVFFCSNHLNVDWTSVMFTDESRFSMNTDSLCGWVMRGVYNDDSFIHQAKYSQSCFGEE